MTDEKYEIFESMNDFMYSLYLEENESNRNAGIVRFLDVNTNKAQITIKEQTDDSYEIRLHIKIYFNTAFLYRAGFEFNDSTERLEDMMYFKFRDEKEMRMIVKLASIIHDSYTSVYD